MNDFTYHERKIVEPLHNTRLGIIHLDHVANPCTMVIKSHNGKTLSPEKFDLYGNPIFSEEAFELYRFQMNFKRNIDNPADVDLNVDIYYDPAQIDTTCRNFDTISGIEKSLNDLNSFTEMLKKRALFYAVTHKSLKEYLVFNNLILTTLGGIQRSIEDFTYIKKPGKKCVRTSNIRPIPSLSTPSRVLIPDDTQKCPCCGKTFSLSDVVDDNLELVNSKIAHKHCAENYQYYRDLSFLLNDIFDEAYGEQFEIPSYYVEFYKCPYMSIIVKTKYGDIKIGKLGKFNISIEWQENFAPFSIAIFNSENVTKWVGTETLSKTTKAGKLPCENVKRGIQAWSKDDAIHYLKLVFKKVRT